LRWLALTILAFAPGIFWLWYFYQKDKYRPEPLRLVIRTFILGMAVVIPVALVESIFEVIYPSLESKSIPALLALSFLIVGPVEEGAKFLAVRLTVYRSPYFDEEVDGMVYSTACALGFASLENLLYLIRFGWQVIMVRATLSTLAHVVMSGMWGYALGRAKLHPERQTILVSQGLIAAMVIHGLFDFLLLTQSAFALLIIPMVVVLVLQLQRRMKLAAASSAQLGKVLTTCPQCQNGVRYDANFCTQCGTRLTGREAPVKLRCSACKGEVRPQDAHCTSCGTKLSKMVS